MRKDFQIPPSFKAAQHEDEMGIRPAEVAPVMAGSGEGTFSNDDQRP